MTDSLLDDIRNALRGPVDDQEFERCASALLRPYHRTLVHIPGGDDSGTDAETADGPEQEIMTATVSVDVIGNMRNSLHQYVRDGGQARRVIVATPQVLTRRKRTNLQKAAEKQGFRLVQAYDYEWFAESLYEDDHWRLQLLGLVGRPPLLSRISSGRRSLHAADFVGREAELTALRNSETDIVLRGRPGTGKTFLLHQLVSEGWGLFLTTSDVGAAAADLRRLQPSRVIVDDAHFAPGLVARLRHFREETGATFRIVATCWPDWEHDPSTELPAPAEMELELLTQKEIIQALVAQGIENPAIQRLILEQARGRIGLATTLAQLARGGFLPDLASGRLVLRDLRNSFAGSLSESADGILCALSLAGERGLSILELTEVLGVPAAGLSSTLRQVASGGLVDALPNRHLVVQPERLRFAMLLDTCFGPVPVLPFEDILRRIPDQRPCAFPLVAARHLGAPIPESLLERLVADSDDVRARIAYAQLGPAEAQWAMKVTSPSELPDVAHEALDAAPAEALRVLLDLATGDDRPIHNATDHGLRKIEDWLQHPDGDPMLKRQHVVDSALAPETDPAVAVHALALALSPTLRWSQSSADGGAVTLYHSTISEELLPAFRDLWTCALVGIVGKAPQSVAPIVTTATYWLAPGMWAPNAGLPDSWYVAARSVAEHVLTDTLRVLGQHPGVRQRLRASCSRVNFGRRIRADRDFETVFPIEASHRTWTEQSERFVRHARRLARAWAEASPEEIVESFHELETEARYAGTGAWPDLTPIVLAEVLRLGIPIRDFTRLAIRRPLRHDLCTLALTRLAGDRPAGWQSVMREAMNNPLTWRAAVQAGLESLPPGRVQQRAVDLVDENFSNYLEFPHSVLPHALQLLLRHRVEDVRRATAVGLWHLRAEFLDGNPQLERKWREVLAGISIPSGDYWVGEIIGQTPELVLPWLTGWIARHAAEQWRFEPIPDPILVAASSIPATDRCEIVRKFPAKARWSSSELFRALVADDDEVLEVLLQRTDLKGAGAALLKGTPDDRWLRRARAALNAGMAIEAIVAASQGGYMDIDSWSGPESEHLEERVVQFRELGNGPSADHKLFSQAGIDFFTARQQAARKRERDEAVFGLH